MYLYTKFIMYIFQNKYFVVPNMSKLHKVNKTLYGSKDG